MQYKKWLVYSLVAILVTPITKTHATRNQTYTLGIVPQFDTRELHKIWKPITRKVESETGIKLKITGSQTIPEFEHEFLRGEFDFAYMNPYHILLASKSQGYIPLVRDVGRKLHGILVVRKDSAITRLQDLNNKKIAFPAPNALGASLIIRNKLANTFNINIIPVYVKTHSSVYLNVAVGETSAGGGVQKTLNQQSDDIKKSLKTIFKSQGFAPHPIAVHPRVPENIRNSIRKALIEMGDTYLGKEILNKVPIKKIGRASMDDYRSLDSLGLDKFYHR